MLLQPSGPGIRRDSGMYEGWNVPMDYDPLLAKLIGYGSDRQQAIMRLERALYEYFVAGHQDQHFSVPADSWRRRFSGGENRYWISRPFDCERQPGGVVDRAGAEIEEMEKIAAIAAGMFAVLDPAAAVGKNGDAGAPASRSIQLETEGTLGSAALILWCTKS